MEYRFCGKSGLKLPAISLGLWHNFGENDDLDNARQMIFSAFKRGITHFDLANNYGPPPGSAEETFGMILKKDLPSYRDEMVITTKAGHQMWDGPYGDGGSRKSIMASINQSLRRTGLEYFDIFYSHRYDPETPLEETMLALADVVRQGKALYIGLSKYPYDVAVKAFKLLKENNVPCLVYQDRYNMFARDIEKQTLNFVANQGSGFVCFSPLAQGLLTDKYIDGIPIDSRAAKASGFLKREQVTLSIVEQVKLLNHLAEVRGQSLAQMALSWILRNDSVTSTIIGASSSEQITDCLGALDNTAFSPEELKIIEQILGA